MMQTTDRPTEPLAPRITTPLPPLREWYCRACGKLLGRFDLATVKGTIRCPRCGHDNTRAGGV